MLWLALLASPSVADQSVTLAWDPNPEPDVRSYQIYYGTASGHYPYATNVGNVTTATVYGLEEGVTWYFAITADNTSGLESDFSNEVTNAIPNAVTNRVPTISPLADLSIAQNGVAGPLAFTVGDAETPAANLTLAGTSTNAALVPGASLVFGGSGAARTLSVGPITDATGTTLITISVSDGVKASSTSFVLFINPINHPPAVIGPPAQHLDEDGSRTVSFTVSDLDTALDQLLIYARSSDPAVVSDDSLVISGSGADRTVTLAPLPNHHGATTVTLAVADATSTNTAAFGVTVNPVNDPPTLVLLQHSRNATQLSFPRLAGWIYTIEYTTSLTNPDWRALTRLIASGGILGFTHANAIDATQF